MNIIRGLFGSSLGKKYLMAVSGLLLFGFVVVHLLGNLQVFLGDDGESINAYGHFLKSKPGLVWGARLGLLGLLVLHVVTAIRVSAENRLARPMGYIGNPTPAAASYASRTMLMSGVIVFSFIVYHLLHYTALVQQVNLLGLDFHKMVDSKGRHDVYRMLIFGFSHPGVAGFYVLSMCLLTIHLSHGLSAMVQSFGFRNRHYRRAVDECARAACWFLFIGYISIPVAILFGLLK